MSKDAAVSFQEKTGIGTTSLELHQIPVDTSGQLSDRCIVVTYAWHPQESEGVWELWTNGAVVARLYADGRCESSLTQTERSGCHAVRPT